MRSIPFLALLLGMVALALVVSRATAATPYTFTTVDFPGATDSEVDDINAHGQMVGVYQDAAGNTHGFLLNKGTFTTIDFPGATGSEGTGASGINASGQIVGNYQDVSGKIH